MDIVPVFFNVIHALYTVGLYALVIIGLMLGVALTILVLGFIASKLGWIKG